MKTIFFWIAIVVVAITSFKGHSKNINANSTTLVLTQNQFATGEIISGYLKIKNALVKSDTKSTAQSARVLEAIITTSNTSQLMESQKIMLATILVDATKEVKNIASFSGKLDKQRRAFQMLSMNIRDLLNNFGATQKLYVDFCPMYEGGSIWLSETKEIKNPFYGAQMLTCGRLKETIK